MLGADVAYLTLHDPDHGDTFMRATAGSVSARFQALRLPLGAGLGGLVAQTRSPYWTTDYPADARYRHTREIDEAVDEEDYSDNVRILVHQLRNRVPDAAEVPQP